MNSIGGFIYGSVFADGIGIAAGLNNGVVVNTPGNTVNYQVTVDTDCAGLVGYPYGLYADMAIGAGPVQSLYRFAAQASGPVFDNQLPTPGATMNFCECAGVIRIRFLDGNNAPVSVTGGTVTGYLSGGGDQARATIQSGSTEKRIVVRGNESGYRLDISFTTGTNPYSDLVTSLHQVIVPTPCDAELVVDCVVPSGSGTGGNPNTLGEIVGQVNMLRECEHLVSSRTFMALLQGPHGNYRYDTVALDGSLPLPGCSQGPFRLENLVPSASQPYLLYGEMNFRFGRRSEYFRTPSLDPATVNGGVFVTGGQIANLGNTFVIDPGYVRGNIFLCGAPEQPGQSNACLRFIFHDPDADGNLDGIPDDLDISHTYVYASGVNSLAPGAIKTAHGGAARTAFEGSFANGAFSGDYELVVGGLNQQASLWNANTLVVQFENTTTLADFQSSRIGMIDNLFPTQEIQPGQAVTNHHRYCLSKVVVHLTSTTAPFYQPYLEASGGFVGKDFEGNAADYTAGVAYAYGTPINPGQAANSGQINLCVAQGTYNLSPRVLAQNPNGTFSNTDLRPITNLVVGCKQCLEVHPELQIYVTNAPPCTSNQMFTFAGFVNSLNPVDISYSLNGATSFVPVCNNCPPNSAFNIPVTLAPCVNSITVKAVDHVLNITALVTDAVTLDVTPPVLSGCTNLSTNSLAGTNGNFVSYSVTAVDNCDGTVPVTCVPASGSFFATGQTTVTCTAADQCHNTNTCQFTVTVGSECPGPVAWYPLEGTVTDIAGANQPSATVALSFVPGQIGQGVTFPQYPAGIGHIEIPHVPALANQRFTFEAWVRPDGIGPNNDAYGSCFIQKVRDGGFSYSIYWRSDGKFTFLTGAIGSSEIQSTHNFPAGCFYHVAGTYDGADFRLFVDGVLEGQRASTAPIDYSGGYPWTIGASPTFFQSSGYARTWNGVIDELKIWCRALSAPEIQSAYRAGGPVDCPCLRVSNENLACESDTPGKLNYSFDLYNNTGVPVKYLFLVPKDNCFAFMPNVLTFNPPLLPGQTVQTNVMVSFTGACPTNLCFLVSAHDSNLVRCCSIMHCVQRDTTPPVFAGCTDLFVALPDGQPSVNVNYLVTATDASSPPVTLTCTPPPPGPFPPGTTFVNCVAVDACGNSDSCRFSITVTTNCACVGTTTAPLNDTPATAIPLTAPATVSGCLAYAGPTPPGVVVSFPPLPPPLSQQNARDVWYSFSPAAGGVVTVDTCGATDCPSDTVLAVYQGAPSALLINPSRISGQTWWNDTMTPTCSVNPLAAQVKFNARACATYYIRVSARQGNLPPGGFTLTLTQQPATPPPSDDCSSAKIVSANSSTPFRNIAASTSTTTPAPPPFNDVWFRFVAPPTAANATVETCTTFASALAIYSGNCNNLIPVTWTSMPANCPAGAIGEKVTFSVTPGVAYRIRVGGVTSTDAGCGFLRVSAGLPPPNTLPLGTPAACKIYRILGRPSGQLWSWSLTAPQSCGFNLQGSIPTGIPSTGTAFDVAAAMALSINTAANGSIVATACATPSCATSPTRDEVAYLRICTPCPANQVVLKVGPSGNPDCWVENQDFLGTIAPCVFNPSIHEISDSDADAETPIADCNGNGQSDYVDIALGTSEDEDGNGIPDECSISLNVAYQASNHAVVLSWPVAGAILEQSFSVDGPWNEVPGATSPHAAGPATGQTFYRLRLR